MDGRPFRGIRYLAPGHKATALFRRGDGVGVRRLALSTALAARADALGVKRLDASATAPVLYAEGVEVAGVSGSWLAVADGLHSPLRRALGLYVEPDPGAGRATDCAGTTAWSPGATWSRSTGRRARRRT